MAVQAIAPEKLRAAYRYANLLPSRPERLYAFEYISWMRNGAVGYPPERGRLSVPKAEGIKCKIRAMNLWDF